MLLLESIVSISNGTRDKTLVQSIKVYIRHQFSESSRERLIRNRMIFSKIKTSDGKNLINVFTPLIFDNIYNLVKTFKAN